MITHADLPDELNLATWFVDRNVEEGRGDRTALIGPDRQDGLRRAGAPRESLRQPAPRARRPRPGPCPPRPRRLRGIRRALVRRAEDRSRHRRGVHVPPAEGLRLLPRVHRREGRGGRRGHGGCDSGGRRRPAGPRRGRGVRRAPPGRVGRAGARADDEGRHRALEVHDREHRPAEGRRPSRAQPGAEQRLVRAGRARNPRGRRRPAGAEALLRLRARPDRALPVRRRRRRDRLPGALDAGADLRADRRAPADDPRQRADDDGPDDRLRQTWPVPGTRHVLFAHVHVGRRGAPAGAARPLAGHVRRRGAGRDRLVRAVPHLHLEPARPRSSRARPESSCPATRRRSTRPASCSSPATRPRSSTGTTRRRRSARSTATPSARATSSSATTTASSGTGAEPTT